MLPAAGPDTTLQLGLAVVVEVVVVVVVVVVVQVRVVQTSCWAELQTQVLQSTMDRAPGVQVPGAWVVVVVVVVVVTGEEVVDSSWQDEVEEITQSPQLLVTTAPELSVAVAHQGREESA